MLEEFHGPFDSWEQISAGSTASATTSIFQAALNTLGRSASPLLFLNPGLYEIDQELALGIGVNGATQGVLGVTILGHSRADTEIRFVGDGPETTGQQAVMFRHNGVSQLRFGRLKLNGNGIATVGYLDAFDNSANYFPTGHRLEDIEFTNLHQRSPLSGPQSETAGMQLGTLGYGASEGSFWRLKFNQVTDHDYTFDSNTVAVMTYNANSLNNFFWDCEIVGMQWGLTNYTFASNYAGDLAAARCAFQTLQADIAMANVSPNFGSRWNYARNAWRHIDGEPIGNVTSHITVQGCTLGETSTTHVQLGNPGPILMIDNVVAGNLESATSEVNAASAYSTDSASGEEFGIGNHYASATPYFTNGATRIRSIDDLTSVTFTDPGFPTRAVEPPAVSRHVYEPASATLAAVIDAVNLAISDGYDTPVIHIPYGDYPGTEVLELPANWKAFIEGDGRSVTRLRRTGSNEEAVVKINQPSLVWLRGFTSHGGDVADGVTVVGSAAGGVVHLEDCYNSGSVQLGCFRAVNQGPVAVDLLDCHFGGCDNEIGEYAVSAEGDTTIHAVFGTYGNGNEPFFRVLDGGVIATANIYAENTPSHTSKLVAPNCSGTLNLDGGHIGTDNLNADFSTFDGLATVSNFGFDVLSTSSAGDSVVLGNNTLLLGCSFSGMTTPWVAGSGATEYAVLLPRNGAPGAGNYAVAESIVGVSDVDSYVRSHMAALRAVKPVDLVDSVPAGHCQLVMIGIGTDHERTAFNLLGDAVVPSEGIEMNYRGTWGSSTSYAAGDVVRYNGAGFVAAAASTGVTPVDGATWALLAGQSAGRVDTYSNATFYAPGDTTVYDGATYVCTRSTQGSAPAALKDFALLERGQHLLWVSDCNDIADFAWSGVSDSAHASVGSASNVLYSNVDGTAGAYGAANTPSFAPGTRKLRAQTRIYLTAMGIGTGACTVMTNGSSSQSAVLYNYGGTWVLGMTAADSSWIQVNLSQTFNLNQWYTLELLVDASGTHNVATLYVNGVLAGTLTDTTTGTQWVPALAQLGLSVNGSLPAASGISADYDQVLLLDS